MKKVSQCKICGFTSEDSDEVIRHSIYQHPEVSPASNLWFGFSGLPDPIESHENRFSAPESTDVPVSDSGSSQDHTGADPVESDELRDLFSDYDKKYRPIIERIEKLGKISRSRKPAAVRRLARHTQTLLISSLFIDMVIAGDLPKMLTAAAKAVGAMHRGTKPIRRVG